MWSNLLPIVSNCLPCGERFIKHYIIFFLTSFPDGIKFHHEDKEMSWFQKLFNTKPDKSIQEANRNRAAFQCLRSLAFGPQEIRKALVELNKIKVKDLARADGVSAVTIYNTIKGRRTNPTAMALIASRLALNIEDLFPERVSVGAGSRLRSIASGSSLLQGEKEPQACTPEIPEEPACSN
jgi:transcriptional regulator with XRE-family HTH domain